MTDTLSSTVGSPPPPPSSQHSTSSSTTSTPAKPHNAHIRTFFETRPSKTWGFTSFDTHCRSFPDYDWSRAKIYSFWLKHLNRLLDEKSPLAQCSKIKQLLRATKDPTSCHARKPKSTKNVSQTSPITFVQGSTVGPINISNTSVNSTSKVETLNSQSDSVPPSKCTSSTINTKDEHDANSQFEFSGTPPAPPPDPHDPSPAVFHNGISIDSWFSTLRDNPPKPLRFPYLLDSNIVDLDDEPIRKSCQQTYLTELQSQLASCLPPISSHVNYALDRFSNLTSITSYREVSETSPRPPGVPWSRENHPASYINQAIFHLVTLMDKFLESMVNLSTYLREGFFDSSVNPWFIDALFLGGRYPDLVVSRKEIQSYIVGYGEKSDAVFRYVNGVLAFDLGVIEVSGGATNVNNDPKSDRDHAKVHRALAGNLDILGGLVRKEWEYMERLQVFGIINNGWNVTILQMIYISPQVKLLKMHRTYRIPIYPGQIKTIFPLLMLMTQCQAAMEGTVQCILEYQEANY